MVVTKTLWFRGEQDLFVLHVTVSSASRGIFILISLCDAANQNIPLCFCTSHITITCELWSTVSRRSSYVTSRFHRCMLNYSKHRFTLVYLSHTCPVGSTNPHPHRGHERKSQEITNIGPFISKGGVSKGKHCSLFNGSSSKCF